MSLKSLIQVVITLIIIVILGGVYFNYFSNNNKILLENNETNTQKEVDENKPKKKETKTLNAKADLKDKIIKDKNIKNEEVKVEQSKNTNPKNKAKQKKPEIENIVKDIEYLTTDKSGNRYKILATSGRTNLEDKNILDLDNVRGIITSDKNSTVYIVSDFAEYNSSNLKSNFYQNVIINYEDKQITCDYFDVDMQTNIAIAYNNVVVTDQQSIMKAGKIILNIETKVININPDNKKNKVSLTIN
tara:strand:- start:704 stop:1438 length:735 start_codon:yes stop_codon:yes gene_type:complete